jgi:MinD-like ATPase involved in chromosome partitioning or flagellar assembly
VTLLCLASAHGSPGVTTTALALAAAWPQGRRPLLVEADPFGGVLAPRFGLWDTPGLASLTVGSRRGIDPEMVWGHAQRLPGGLPVLVGPPSSDQAHAVLRDLSPALADWSAGGSELDVIADCGRLSPNPPVLAALQRADGVLLVSRPTPDQLRAAAHRMGALADAGVRLRLLLVGDSPYGPAEVASTLSVEVAGVMAWDPAAAETLSGGPVPRTLRRSALVRSAASVAQRLVAELADPDGGPDLPPAEEPGGGALP